MGIIPVILNHQQLENKQAAYNNKMLTCLSQLLRPRITDFGSQFTRGQMVGNSIKQKSLEKEAEDNVRKAQYNSFEW